VDSSRRVKIVCTLGPAVASYEGLRGLVETGMDVARLNLSHGSHEMHRQSYGWVRRASDEVGRGVGVMADLQGPKIRLGRFEGGSAVWQVGDRVVVTTELVVGSPVRVSTTYAGLAGDVAVGDRLLIDDGNLALQVEAVDGPDVVCCVLEGGPVSDAKGISLPDADVAVPALSAKDEDDLRFALSLRVDMVAMSFVRSPDDALDVRRILEEEGAREVGIIAKVEKPQAVQRLEAILDAFDGIMVARGDLGVELPLEHVPMVQKKSIALARRAGKPVIVATQMLESMRTHSRPTRAEASDVANAVLDGADAVMLSAETSVGAYPHGAVRTMDRICRAAELDPHFAPPDEEATPETRSAALARAACLIGGQVGATALVPFTVSGSTVRRLVRHRPAIPIFAFTPNPLVRSQLAVCWGVETFIAPPVASTDAMVRQCDVELVRLGRAKEDDLVVIVAGSPPGVSGTTNIVRVHRIGELDPE
jgi:pyruvate kinase